MKLIRNIVLFKKNKYFHLPSMSFTNKNTLNSVPSLKDYLNKEEITSTTSSSANIGISDYKKDLSPHSTYNNLNEILNNKKYHLETLS